MADQVDRLILETETSEQNLQRLTQELARVEDKISALQSVFQAGGISFEKFDEQLEGLSNQAQAFRGALGSLESGTALTSEKTSSLTRSFTTLTYSINDAQQFSLGFTQGIRAISNNIPGLIQATQNLAGVGFTGIITALTGPAGLILGLTTLSTLIPLVAAHWGELEDWWSGGTTGTEAEQMDALAKATSRTADETDRLNKYKREQATSKKLEESEPAARTEARQALEKAVPELPGGYENLRDVLVQARNPQGLAGRYTQEDRQLIEDARSVARLIPTQANIGAARQTEVDVEARVRERERQRAGEDISRSIANPEQLVGLLNELRRAGRADLASQLEAAPGAKAGRKSAEEESKIEFDLQKAIHEVEQGDLKKREQAAKEDAKIQFELQKAIAEVEQDDKKKRKQAVENEAKINYDLQKAIAEVETGDRKKRLEEAKKSGGEIVAGAAAKAGGNVAGISQLLQSLGMDKESAEALAGEAIQTHQRSRLQEFFGKKPRNVEVYETSDYLSRVQTAVGGAGDTGQRQLQEQIAMNQKLQVLLENTKKFGLSGNDEGTFK